jgi:hypothetical protein
MPHRSSPKSVKTQLTSSLEAVQRSRRSRTSSRKPALRVDEEPRGGAAELAAAHRESQQDPNYDSENSDAEGCLLAAAPDLPSQLQSFRAAVTQTVNELFLTENFEEFAQAVTELKSPALNYELVRRLLSLAMERNAKEREIASRALAFLVTSQTVHADQVAKGFERLLELCNDLELDVPQAKDFIARFLARAVSDEILPPAMLRPRSDFADSAPGIIEQARHLLSTRHSAARLSRVWGPTALVRTSGDTNDDLKAEIKLLLTEFMSSGDLDEAVECVKRLDAPHFHHEVVKRAVVLALDGRQRQRAMMSALLAELHGRTVMSSDQIMLGFKRLKEEMDDLELDTPGASRVVRVFFEQAVRDGICADGGEVAHVEI